MGYRTTRQADDDIIGTYLDGYRKFGRLQAERYHDGLAKTFGAIAWSPYIARERTEFTPPVRLHRYNAHLIIYRVGNEDILIIRVLHGRQNWEQLL
jgi:toxin ParE1/3/4